MGKNLMTDEYNATLIDIKNIMVDCIINLNKK